MLLCPLYHASWKATMKSTQTWRAEASIPHSPHSRSVSETRTWGCGAQSKIQSKCVLSHTAHSSICLAFFVQHPTCLSCAFCAAGKASGWTQNATMGETITQTVLWFFREASVHWPSCGTRLIIFTFYMLTTRKIKPGPANPKQHGNLRSTQTKITNPKHIY